jgi:hypothetical protein
MTFFAKSFICIDYFVVSDLNQVLKALEPAHPDPNSPLAEGEMSYRRPTPCRPLQSPRAPIRTARSG